ncbi:hypothetical protein TSUD_202130 [Trifolium subterraneum]|uniref:Reverse transcriptase zinc-binding domain-containing protein n=1 Tax=Trifolium subterraneum TaxID=3900 RepID=A0A2Z6LLC6_TRISU|nr:hypothetical protein TSUD_202130 [Trifolium subterraneum]
MVGEPESFAPLEVIIFNWQLLRLRLPTRANLLHCCVSAVQGALCCGCSLHQETETHLFATCRVAAAVWTEEGDEHDMAISDLEAMESKEYTYLRWKRNPGV